jgi:septal ring factor EnvC (AmiA/AmiB activator)
MKIKIIKGEVMQYMENLSKKNQTDTPNTVGVYSSRLEQLDDKISEIKDKIEIKGKAKDILAKQLKSCESNMQEFSNSIKRPNMRIMVIEEGEEVPENRYVIYSIK